MSYEVKHKTKLNFEGNIEKKDLHRRKTGSANLETGIDDEASCLPVPHSGEKGED